LKIPVCIDWDITKQASQKPTDHSVKVFTVTNEKDSLQSVPRQRHADQERIEIAGMITADNDSTFVGNLPCISYLKACD
jgi:hypothetical protein